MLILTLLLLLAALLHLFLFVYNRFLLCITDGPWKAPIHFAWFVASIALPILYIALFWGSSALQAALRWAPNSPLAYWYFLLMGAVIAFFGARSLAWAIENFFPDKPRGLVGESTQKPVVPAIPSQLPRGFRSLDSTGDLEVVERELAIAGLAPAFDGLTIAQVSDVHFGQRLEMENYLEAVRDIVTQLDADILVFTGDFVDKRRDIDRSVAYHAGFRGRLGTFCVLGNHDYWTNADRLKEALSRTHIRWLGDGERRTHKSHGRRLIFTGTDAPWDGRRPDWGRIVRRGTGDAVVLLSHTPDNAPAAARHGAALILSGHNHGGQVRLPLVGPVVVPSRHGLRYAGGVYRVGGDSILNVSRGVGVSSGGVRILCPPEICLLTLRAPVVEVMAGRMVPARALLRPARPQADPGGIIASPG